MIINFLGFISRHAIERFHELTGCFPEKRSIFDNDTDTFRKRPIWDAFNSGSPLSSATCLHV